MKESLDEVIEMIYNGKISIRRASQEFGYTRYTISSALFKKYGNDENLKEILKEYKDNSTALEIDSELIAEVFEKAMYKEITLTEAREMLGIKDKETLRMVFLKYAENSENEEIRTLYNAIYRNRNKIKTPMDIILVEGICPLDKDDEYRRLLDSGLNSLENMCMQNLGISINRRTVSSSSILVDSINRKVVLENGQEIDMPGILTRFENAYEMEPDRRDISGLLHQNTKDLRGKSR